MKDKDESKLEQLAKKLLNMKPKPRQDMVGKGKKKNQNTAPTDKSKSG